MKKKIAALLCILCISGSGLFAADAVVNSWLETRGHFEKKGDSDATLNRGEVTLSTQISVADYNWGANAKIGVWADVNSGVKAPKFQNTYMWSGFFENALKLYAGLDYEHPTMFTPARLIQGGGLFDYAFGNGYGAYDHQGDFGYTTKTTGITAEIAVSDLTAAIILKNGSKIDAIDVTKNNLIFNAKYTVQGLADIYAGYATKDEAGAIWGAVAFEMIPSLDLDVKFETELKGDSMVAVNLGYIIPAAHLKTTVHLGLGDNVDTDVDIQVSPFLDIFELDVNGKIGLSNASGSKLDWGAGFDITKAVGDVTNMLSFSVESEDGADPTIKFGYTVNIWI